MTSVLAPLPAPALRRSAARPSSVERITCVLMMFFLAYSTPDQWLRSAEEARELQDQGAVDSFAVLIILAFAGIFAFQMAGNWRPLWWLARQDRLFLGFFAIIGLSTLWSDAPSDTLRETVVLSIVIFYALYLVTRFELRDILYFAGMALALGIALDFFWVFGLPQYGDSNAGWKGVHPNKNGLGRLHVLTIIVFLVNARTFRRFRLVNYGFAVAGLILVIGSTSATSLVSLILATGTTVVAQVFRARKTLFGAVTLSSVASTVAVIGFATANLGPITDLLGKDITFTGRTPLWEFIFGETLRQPLTGFGWNAYWHGYFSPAHEVWIETAWTPPNSHNAFLDYALQLGWPAVGLFLVMMARAVYRGVVFVRDVPGPTSLFPLAMVAFSFLFSLSEAGVIFRNIFFLLVVVAIYTVAASYNEAAVKEIDNTAKGILVGGG